MGTCTDGVVPSYLTNSL